MDYTSKLYDPLYRRLGIAALLVTPLGDEVKLVVLSETAGVALNFGSGRGHLTGGLQVQTSKPAVKVRMVDLKAKNVNPKTELDKGQIVLNGALRAADLDFDGVESLSTAAISAGGERWRIVAHQTQPSPNGDADGQVLLLLSDERLS